MVHAHARVNGRRPQVIRGYGDLPLSEIATVALSQLVGSVASQMR
jgi:hypothetical protein